MFKATMPSPPSPECRVSAQTSDPWRRENGSGDDLSNSDHWLTSSPPSGAFLEVTGPGGGRRIKAELDKALLVPWSPPNPLQEKEGQRGNDEMALGGWSIGASTLKLPGMGTRTPISSSSTHKSMGKSVLSVEPSPLTY